jgi:hypothetical protein
MVKDQPPIRRCSCKKEDGTPATIVMDMQGKAEGKSQFRQK